MRLPLPVLTVMAVSRGNLPETVGPRRWVHCAFFDFEKQERSAGFTESHPGATPPVSSRADATGMQTPYPGRCAHPSGHHGPPGFSFLRPGAGRHSLNGLPRPPTASGTPTRANGTKPTSPYAAQKAVAGFLGHGRDDVTNLYFMSRPRQTVKRQEMILSSLLFSLMFSI